MIHAYVGLPGTGKTFAMVFDSIEYIKQGHKVFSNFPIRWGQTNKEETKKDPKAKPTYKYKSIFLNPIDFLNAIKYESNGLFLVDECNVVFSSYDDAKQIDRGLLNRFAQGRKANLDFFYTSQRFTHSMKRIRDLTNVVIECRKMSIFTFTLFRNIYYNPVIFDREALFDTPLEAKYIMKKRFIFPWQLKSIYTKYPTEFIVQSASEFKSLTPKVEEIPKFTL